MPKLEIKDLSGLLRDFYNLTDIKTCLYDLDGNELCYYPAKFSRFCEILRRSEDMDKKCKDCDKIALEHCKKTHNQYSYTCHIGLQECISPIIYNDQVVGFIMLGQIKKNNSPGLPPLPKSLPAELVSELRSAYDSLPVISDEKLKSASRIIDVCAGYELLRDFVRSHNNAIDEQIKQYILDNISSPLSVEGLCSAFRLSHSEVYRIFKEYFFCTPADYIKKSRLKYACKLLTTTKFTINDIAARCGIPDYNYFSKVFKAAYKVSPTGYRKKYQE